MEVIIALFFFTLVLLVVLPTLPASRRMRIILAVLAVPGIIGAYLMLHRFASTAGYSAQLDVFIKKSDQLLSQGKVAEVREVLGSYEEQRRGHDPESVALASRASLLYKLIKEKEQQIELTKMREK